MIHRINAISNILLNISFSDVCSFFLNSKAIKQNCRYWSDENLHIFREGHTKHPPKVNVWSGILGNAIIGPLFLEENFTGNLYLDMLEDIIHPLITHGLEIQIDAHRKLLLQKDQFTVDELEEGGQLSGL